MKQVLHIAASPHGAVSHSRQAAEQTLAALQARSPIEVMLRDLSEQPLPHPDATFVSASLMPPEQRSPSHMLSLSLSEALIAELQAADAVLISTPMHNFMLPSVLKAWVDHVLRPGRSFARTPLGKQGLLADRPVAMLMACGGAIGNGDQQDFASPYMAYACQTMGLHNFQSIILENCNRDAARAASLTRLQQWQQGWPW